MNTALRIARAINTDLADRRGMLDEVDDEVNDQIVLDHAIIIGREMGVELDELDRLLEHRFDSDAGDDLTLRGYFHALLQSLWAEGEGFSGKRPFGNSDWEVEVFDAIEQAGGVGSHDLVKKLIERTVMGRASA